GRLAALQAQGGAGLWRLRLHDRVRGRALCPRRARDHAVRGDERDPADRDRAIAGLWRQLGVLADGSETGQVRVTTEKIGTAKQEWLDNVYGPATKKRAERRPKFTSLSGDPIEPLYTADDLAGFDAQRDLGEPGAF